ncbi:MAG: PHB depolymerase family esterase, partial [Gemmatimonadales bacterium]
LALVYPSPAGKPAPLVLVFHGAFGSAGEMARLSGLVEAGAAGGLTLAFLDAPLGNWAEHCDCNNADRLGINDTGFVGSTVDTLARLGLADAGRVFAIGFSQGGLFVQRLACEMADRFRGVVSVAATMSGPLAERCTPARSISVTIMHGTRDPVFPWDGGREGRFRTLGAREAIDSWARRNRCGPQPVSTWLPVPAGSGPRWERLDYRDCAGQVNVSLIVMHGAGHVWPGEAGAALMIDAVSRQK